MQNIQFSPDVSQRFFIISPPGLASSFPTDQNFSKGASFSNNFCSKELGRIELADSGLNFPSNLVISKIRKSRIALLDKMLGEFFPMGRNLPMWPVTIFFGKTRPFREISVSRKGRGQTGRGYYGNNLRSGLIRQLWTVEAAQLPNTLCCHVGLIFARQGWRYAPSGVVQGYPAEHSAWPGYVVLDDVLVTSSTY